MFHELTTYGQQTVRTSATVATGTTRVAAGFTRLGVSFWQGKIQYI